MGEPDPFAIFHTPPPNETAGERVAREDREAAARAVSDRIDDELRQEKARLKKEKIVRVLLLGQAESGKSTTLKNFRYHYARAAWDAERAAWRAVIQLNVVRSVLTILDAVQAHFDGASAATDDIPPTPTTSSLEGSSAGPSAGPSTSAIKRSSSTNSLRGAGAPGTPAHPHRGFSLQQSDALHATHAALSDRLSGLRAIELILMRRLGEGSTEDTGSGVKLGVLGDDEDGEGEPRGRAAALRSNSRPPSRARTSSRGPKAEWGVHRLQEALVRSASIGSKNSGEAASIENPEEDEPTRVLVECRDAITALWTDEGIRALLRKRKIRVEDRAGFFLDDISRIATVDYIPSDADIVRARLRTLGVQEYKITFENTGQVGYGGIGNEYGQQWLLYDVGGSRTLRQAWVPYFDNIQAIIFLAPVSCFDERLAEDSRVNRLEDSFLLFKRICSSKPLSRATIILFLNKCDLLRRKLKSGVKVKDYLPSYGERKNEAATVVAYLREKFREVLREHSTEQRNSYFYATSVVDTAATATTITAVRDSILQLYLKRADFL